MNSFFRNLKKKSTVVLFLASLVLVFLTGLTWQKIGDLESKPDVEASATENAIPGNGKLEKEHAELIPRLSDNDRLRGNRNAGIYLIEYSDLQCKFCQEFHETLDKVVGGFGGKVAWVYRHFPLDDIHPGAREASEAAECMADFKGGESFWLFAEKYMEDYQADPESVSLVDIAAGLGADREGFQKCLDGGTYRNKVQVDYVGGFDAGVRGAPTALIINAKGEAWVIPGAFPPEQVAALISEALK